MRRRLPFLFAFLVACSTGTQLFNETGAGGSDATASTGRTAATSTTSTDATSVTTSASSTSGPGPGPGPSSSTGSEGGAGPGSGGSSMCAHDVCDSGPPLASNCDPCVTQICAADPYCCNQMWDQICVGYVDNVCQIDCFPIGMGPCGMQYPTYPVCSDDNDQCLLAYDATMGSCQSVCQAGGGECLAAYNDVQNQTCQPNFNQPIGCTFTSVQSAVCVCSQGCGNGPACPSTQTCVNGNCI